MEIVRVTVVDGIWDVQVSLGRCERGNRCDISHDIHKSLRQVTSSPRYTYCSSDGNMLSCISLGGNINLQSLT